MRERVCGRVQVGEICRWKCVRERVCAIERAGGLHYRTRITPPNYTPTAKPANESLQQGDAVAGDRFDWYLEVERGLNMGLCQGKEISAMEQAQAHVDLESPPARLPTRSRPPLARAMC